MRVILAVAAAFCLAFPLSAGAASSGVNSDFSAARRHQTVHVDSCVQAKPDLTYQVCQCQVPWRMAAHLCPVLFFRPRCTPAE